jgi:hypothetical protein
MGLTVAVVTTLVTALIGGYGTAAVAVVTTLVTALIGGYGTAAVAVGFGDEQVELDAPASVVGSGPSGSVSVPITPGATGPVPVRLSGLVAGVRVPNPDDAASPVTGRAETGDESLFRVEVPAGSAFVRFELDSIGNGAGTNLDLSVFFDRPGEESVTWDSQSEAAGERVDISEAPAGSYRVVITTVEGASDFTLTTFTVASGSNGGTFTATPSTLAGTAGGHSQHRTVLDRPGLGRFGRGHRLSGSGRLRRYRHAYRVDGCAGGEGAGRRR